MKYKTYFFGDFQRNKKKDFKRKWKVPQFIFKGELEYTYDQRTVVLCHKNAKKKRTSFLYYYKDLNISQTVIPMVDVNSTWLIII